MPLLLGMPGPVERAKLLAMASRIGVGESTRFLAKHKGTFARLAAPGGFTGERFLEQCAPALGEPERLVEGLHVFTFNQIAETEDWRDLCAPSRACADTRLQPAIRGLRAGRRMQPAAGDHRTSRAVRLPLEPRASHATSSARAARAGSPVSTTSAAGRSVGGVLPGPAARRPGSWASHTTRV